MVTRKNKQNSKKQRRATPRESAYDNSFRRIQSDYLRNLYENHDRACKFSPDEMNKVVVHTMLEKKPNTVNVA